MRYRSGGGMLFFASVACYIACLILINNGQKFQVLFTWHPVVFPMLYRQHGKCINFLISKL